MVMKVHEVAVVKGMLLRRQDRQQDIAAHFGVNAGRIAEIATGRRFAKVQPIIDFKLLPKATFDYKLPLPRTRGTSREVGLHTITRSAGKSAKEIERLFMQKCKQYKPLTKDEGDHLFSVLQEIGTHFIKLSQNVSNYQQG